MIKELVRTIIAQFIGIVEKKSCICSIHWDKCAVKIVARQYFDSLVIEIFSKNMTDMFLPLPLVTIDMTDIKEKNLTNEKWIAYLEKKAAELLTKLESKKKIFPNKCCSAKEPICMPDNKCDSKYKEVFYFCDRKTVCVDKPYDDWCKPCKPHKCESEKKCEDSESSDCSSESSDCSSESSDCSSDSSDCSSVSSKSSSCSSVSSKSSSCSSVSSKSSSCSSKSSKSSKCSSVSSKSSSCSSVSSKSSKCSSKSASECSCSCSSESSESECSCSCKKH